MKIKRLFPPESVRILTRGFRMWRCERAGESGSRLFQRLCRVYAASCNENRVYKYRVYLKCYSKLQEWVPHARKRKKFHIDVCPPTVFRGTVQYLSPDLIASDFYLWGHLKPLVYSAEIESEETLHHHILLCPSDRSQLPGDYWKGATGRVQTCPCVRWGYFEHLLSIVSW